MSLEINLIEGERGKLHVTSDDARTENAVIFGRGRKVLNMDEMFDAVLIGNNTVRILSGVLYNNGTFIRIDREDYKEVNIENGLNGTYRNDLICIRYERNIQTHIESACLVVKKGAASENTAVDPTYTEGNILEFDSVDEFPLYRVRLDGIHPTLEPMFEVADAMDNSTLYEKIRYQQQVDASMQQELAAHQQDDRNPHHVTKEQLGLGNVDNTSDMDKPVSNLQKGYISNVENTLRSNITSVESTLGSNISDIARVTELILSKTNGHISNKDNPHNVTKAQVGLENADNTADKDKNVKYSDSTGKLSKAVKINGVEFDGSKDIEIGDSERNMITDTATGENITISNSADAPVRSLRIYGKTEQFITTGKNLFGGLALADKLVELVTGATKNESDKTVTFISNNVGGKVFFDNFKENTQYTFILNGSCTNEVQYSNMQIRYTDDTVHNIPHFNANKQTIVTTLAGKTIKHLEGVWYGGYTTLYYEKCGVFEGTITLEDFEPYTGGVPSPNPNHPQDIKGIGANGNVEVTTTGKNLLDISEILSFNVKIIDVYLDAGQYVFTHSGVEQGGDANPTIVFDSEGNKVSEWIKDANNKIYTVTESGTKRIVFYSNGSQYSNSINVTSVLRQAMLRKIEITDDTYEPYKSQPVQIPIDTAFISVPTLYDGDSATVRDGWIDYERHYETVVFDGSEDWLWFGHSGINQFYLPKNDVKYVENANDVYVHSSHFSGIPHIDRENNYETIYVMYSTEKRICFNTQVANTVQEWKEWLSENPIKVVYELAEPKTETYYKDIEISTYKNITNISNSENANMEVEYFINSDNGNVVVDLQKQIDILEKTKASKEDISRLETSKANKTDISRLETSKANVSDLKDYVVVEKRHTIVYSETGRYNIEKSGYMPIFVNINESNPGTIICTYSNIVKDIVKDDTGYYVDYSLYNIAGTGVNTEIAIEVVYIRNI